MRARASTSPSPDAAAVGVQDAAGHRYRPIASLTRRATLRLSTSRSIASSAFSFRSRASSLKSASNFLRVSAIAVLLLKAMCPRYEGNPAQDRANLPGSG